MDEDITEVPISEDPSVPTDLLDLYVELEENDVTPEEFKKAYGA